VTVNGFELPAAFVQLCEAIERGEAPREWDLKENVDAYGEPWEVADLRIHCDPKEIQSDTDRLSKMFDEGRFQHGGEVPPDEVLPEPPPDGWPIAHGCIEDEDFTGVANFVSFASATDGMVYCFDFGTDPKEPSVVYWEEGYWRRVAPNFETFMALFDDGLEAGQSLSDDEDDEEHEVDQPTPRNLLAHSAERYVLGSRVFRMPFEFVAYQYRACSPEERREVEAELREELGRMGMTPEQRWTLDELWARLHATEPA
jgi:SMI1-KNR4 cell-wall